MLAVDELFEETTAAEVKAKAFDLAEGLGLAVTSWGPFSPTRAVYAVFSYIGAAALNLTTVIAKSGFLTTAEGPWKAIVAKLVYDVDKIEKTFGTGEVTFDNNGGSLIELDPGELVFLNTTSGKTYFNTAAVSIAPLEQDVAIPIQASEAGSSSNAAPGEIDDLVTKIPDTVVTNALAVVAVDDEADDALEERSLLSLGALSPNGPKSAIAFVAMTPELVRGVVINRVLVGTPPGDATLDVWIAGPEGEISDPEKDDVQVGVDEWATPEIGTITIRKATNHPLGPWAITISVRGNHGLTAGEWQTYIREALDKWVNGTPGDPDADPPVAATAGLPIGGFHVADELPGADGVVPWRLVEAQVQDLEDPSGNSLSEFIVEAKLASETNEAIDESEVPKLDPLDVTVTVVEV